MVWRITTSNLLVDDADAITYLAAVEAADGQALESGVRLAVNVFIKGCKADGIWPAIKASCILAGARTLSGALVPLAGAAPTNNNFGSGDYNRKTGLLGDGISKSLDSNRANNADPKNNRHLSLYVSTASTIATSFYMGGENGSRNSIFIFNSLVYYALTEQSVNSTSRPSTSTGFIGAARSSQSATSWNVAGASGTGTTQSDTLFDTVNIFVFCRTGATFSNGRIAFYSIGESLNLNLLNSRVTTLINAIATAIP